MAASSSSSSLQQQSRPPQPPVVVPAAAARHDHDPSVGEDASLLHSEDVDYGDEEYHHHRRAASLNNAGVLCLRAGHPKVAWDLFKGSLEVTLASERVVDHQHRRQQHQHRAPHEQQQPLSNTYVQRAEAHLDRLDQYIGGTSTSTNGHSQQQRQQEPARLSLQPSQRSSASSLQNQEDDSSYYYCPLLCSAPFSIPPMTRTTTRTERRTRRMTATANDGGDDADDESSDEDDDESGGASSDDNNDRNNNGRTRWTSAAIIFNLALVDHLYNRASRQAISLYELASSLLVGDEMDALGICLVNNIGVWCYENDDKPSAARCMEHLSRLLHARAAPRLVDPRDREGLVSNILWVLNPPCTASPAA